MKKLILAILLVCGTAQAQEKNLPNWQPAIVGAGLIFAPVALQSNDLSWGHGMELEGWSYAATDILGRFLPKDFWFLSPIVIGAVDGMYRAGENTPLAYRKLACDLTGVLGRVAVEIKF